MTTQTNDDNMLIPKSCYWLSQTRDDYKPPAGPQHKHAGARRQTPEQRRAERSARRQAEAWSAYWERREQLARNAEKLNKPDVAEEIRRTATEERREYQPLFDVAIIKMTTENTDKPDEKTPSFDYGTYEARRQGIENNNRRERRHEHNTTFKPAFKHDRRLNFARRGFNAILRIAGRRNQQTTEANPPTTATSGR